MGKFWFGLIAGLMIGGLVCFLVTPKMEEKANKTGYDKGISEGTADGITQGKAEQKQYNDSLVAIAKKAAEVPKVKVVKRVPKKYVNPYDVNYNVEGNNIADKKE